MNNNIFAIAALAAGIAIVASPTSARDLEFGTGSETGNYYGMMQDIAYFCGSAELGIMGVDRSGNPNAIVSVVSGGSIANMEGMHSKQFIGGIVQEDVAAYLSRQSPSKYNPNNMKVIAGLHSETMHVLIPKGYTPENSESGGFFGKISGLFSGDEGPVELDIQALKNQTVGSWGGSIVSAMAISSFLDLNLTIKEVTAEQAKTANVPMIIVGGQPYKPVQDLLDTGNYVMVGLNQAVIAQRAPFYMPDGASYSVGGSISTVNTVAVRAVLFGKAFRSKARNQKMSDLSNCIHESVADMADDPETNPNWSTVYEFMNSNQMPAWVMFN